EGHRVEVLAQPSLYQARGDFQLGVEQMRQAGAGDLFQEFMRLRARLEAEGLFDPRRKRPIAPLPRAIGVVTSPAAAALRDVLTTLARRAPHVPVIVYPTPVQGAEAPPAIVAAIELANRRREVDVLLLVRGGGSIEDLWSFNDERVARAIFASTLPVIAGVGHETDVTIADFVADARAPTPTGAAVMAATDRRELLEVLERRVAQIVRCAGRSLRQAEQRLDMATRLLRPPSEIQARRAPARTGRRWGSPPPPAAWSGRGRGYRPRRSGGRADGSRRSRRGSCARAPGRWRSGLGMPRPSRPSSSWSVPSRCWSGATRSSGASMERSCGPPPTHRQERSCRSVSRTGNCAPGRRANPAPEAGIARDGGRFRQPPVTR